MNENFDKILQMMQYDNEQNESIQEGKMVMSVLADNEAYKKYISTKKAQNDFILDCRNDKINDIKYYISDKVSIGEMNVTVKFKRINVNDDDINYIMGHFINNGYNIKYDIVQSNWFGRLLKLKPNTVVFTVNWDFDKLINSKC